MTRCSSHAFALRLVVLWLSFFDSVGFQSVCQKRAANSRLGNKNLILSQRNDYIRTPTRIYSTNLETSSSNSRGTSARQERLQVLTRPANPSVTAHTTTTTVAATTPTDSSTPEGSPTTLKEAFRVFFLDKYHGPRLAALSVTALTAWRCYLAATSVSALASASMALGVTDVAAFSTAVVFWWVQEHVLHLHVLHSKADWMGKEIHEGHHANPYFHISIDPAGLIMSWFLTVHLIFSAILPLPIALSATVGYATAGLFYEWAHFIVHTKVRFRKQSYWSRMKDHHIRHHLVDDRYWLGFSVPMIDDLFRTNPNVQEVKRARKIEQQQQEQQVAE
jgi:hypothetical protein